METETRDELFLSEVTLLAEAEREKNENTENIAMWEFELQLGDTLTLTERIILRGKIKRAKENLRIIALYSGLNELLGEHHE